MYTGSRGWQSHLDVLTKFFGLPGMDAVVAEFRGHSLGEHYVVAVLQDWFPFAETYVWLSEWNLDILMICTN